MFTSSIKIRTRTSRKNGALKVGCEFTSTSETLPQSIWLQLKTLRFFDLRLAVGRHLLQSLILFLVSQFHGRMNYKDTKPYMSAFLSVDLLTDFAALCLTDFIDWRYIHSWFVFSTQLVNCCPPWMGRNYTCVLLSVAPLLYLLSDLLPHRQAATPSLLCSVQDNL